MAVPFKRSDYTEPITKQRPMFTQPLQNIDFINEGKTAHFECRLIPIGNSSMTVEWFRNEKPLETSKIKKEYLNIYIYTYYDLIKSYFRFKNYQNVRFWLYIS